MSKRPEGIGYSEYREIFSKDFKFVAEAMGFNVANSQTFSSPPIYPFVHKALEYKKGAFVTKVVFGSPNPNLDPVPLRGKAKKQTEDSPHIVYHVFDNGSTHWNYPYADENGQIHYFYGNNILPNGVVEYLSSNPDIKKKLDLDIVKKFEAIKKIQANEKAKAELKRRMSMLRREGRMSDPITWTAQDLYLSAKVAYKDLRYRTCYDQEQVLQTIEFGTKKGFRKDGKTLIFVTPKGSLKNNLPPHWVLLSKDGSHQKINFEKATSFIASL